MTPFPAPCEIPILHEHLSRAAPATHAARSVRQVFLRPLEILVAFKRGIAHPGDFGMRGKVLDHREAVLAVLGHVQVQALEAEVEVERVLRRLDRSEITHELGGCLRNERPSNLKRSV